jgi:hypothetical protein
MGYKNGPNIEVAKQSTKPTHVDGLNFVFGPLIPKLWLVSWGRKPQHDEAI